jgi:starch phosphorylase
MEIRVRVDSLFDVHIKRIHEYKRQLMNIIYVVYRYRLIKGLSSEERSDLVPRVVIFSGKAAPGYYMAKLIIKFINTVAERINSDPDIEGLLTVIFIPEYKVSLAELLIPASDVSQHISTAGKEASGTSNMKFVMNGGLILGTLDGANVEIKDHVGEENMFIFGKTASEVEAIKRGLIQPVVDERFEMTLNLIRSGYVGIFPELQNLLQSLDEGNDSYLVGVDFGDYLEAQERVDITYKDTDLWTRMSIYSTAGTGYFSSDRSIREYSENIWGIEKCVKPAPTVIDPRKLPSYLTESSATPLSLSPGIGVERYGKNPAHLLSLSPDYF